MSKKIETNHSYSNNTNNYNNNDFQESVNQSFDETKDNIKKSLDESREQIPRINESVNNYQEQSIQTAKEISVRIVRFIFGLSNFGSDFTWRNFDCRV